MVFRQERLAILGNRAGRRSDCVPVGHHNVLVCQQDAGHLRASHCPGDDGCRVCIAQLGGSLAVQDVQGRAAVLEFC